MWRLSDFLLRELERGLEESYRSALRDLDSIEWRELPEAKSCELVGVDGSRGMEKLSCVIFYAISAVAVGRDVLEMHDVGIVKPHVHVEDRIRLRMHTAEFRIASFSEADLVLLDGTLSGAIVRPPAYVERISVEELRRSYELEGIVEDFVSFLDEWVRELEDEVRRGEAKRTLTAADAVVENFERGYRRGESRREDLTIFLEYVEYLHALDRLLRKPVAFVAKNFYTTRLSKAGDALALELFAIERLRRQAEGYVACFEKPRKAIPSPLAEKFRNVARAGIHSAYVRLSEGSNLILVESPRGVEEAIAAIRSVEVDGYPIQLIHAHRYARIRKKELKAMMQAMISAIDAKYAPMLRRPRDVLEVR
ncbi:MAG: DNA double-strand break repair nuclease NurA [Archaeoglobaceae archaeon]